MAEAAGRRPDETSSPQSQRQGPETWLLALIVALALLAVAGLMALAAG